jgi:MoaA/NifB/PqqE/SkfB family radical SAM enzyme
MRSTAQLILKLPLYWSFREIGKPIVLPFNYTLSITYRCNSRCKTCHIWEIQQKIPEKEELTTEEWERVLKSLGDSPYWITISGGEPFLRKDLDEIISIIDEYNKPKIINIPTNGILWNIIPKKVEEILKSISEHTNLVINFSLDGIGKDHDMIRGIPNNYDFLVKAYEETYKLKEKYHNLVIGIHTVISSWNVDKIPQIYETVLEKFKPDQYITEIAEERNEMENFGEGITPPPEKYDEAVSYLISKIKERLKQGGWRNLALITEAFRIEYYEIVRKLYKERKQQIKSYAGFASTHISPVGEVWECAVYATSMGNLRDYDYDFRKLWTSKQAQQVRQKVKQAHPCPLANESYSNMLLSPVHLYKVAKNIFYNII